MDTYFLRQKGTAVPYSDYLLRTFLALVAAHTVVSYGEPESLAELLAMPYYYISLLGSFIIAILLANGVYLITRLLDYFLPWKVFLPYRLGAQLVLGVWLMTLLASLLARLYFHAFNLQLEQTAYLRYYLPLVRWLLIAFNLYYMVLYLYRTHFEYFKEVIKDKRLSLHNLLKPNLKLPLATDEVVFIEVHDRDVFVFDQQGNKYYCSLSMKQCLALLDQAHFFQIQRGYIVQRKFIKSLRKGSSNTIEITLLVLNEKQLTVSQRRAVAFKRWFSGGAG